MLIIVQKRKPPLTMQLEPQLQDLANKAHIKINLTSDMLSLSHDLKWNNKTLWAFLFFLCGGIFLMVISFIKNADTTSKIIGFVIGLPLVILTILTVIRAKKDHLKLDPTALSYCHNLKTSSLLPHSNLSLQMDVETTRTRRSTFVIVSLNLKKMDGRTRVFTFQMDQSDEENARKLGKHLTQLFNERLPS